MQSLAWSTDGTTFTEADDNPVLVAADGVPDFRDPEGAALGWGRRAWVMVLAAGDEVRLFTSTDLHRWTQTDAHRPSPAHRGALETPDLFPLTADDGTEHGAEPRCAAGGAGGRQRHLGRGRHVRRRAVPPLGPGPVGGPRARLLRRPVVVRRARWTPHLDGVVEQLGPRHRPARPGLAWAAGRAPGAATGAPGGRGARRPGTGRRAGGLAPRWLEARRRRPGCGRGGGASDRSGARCRDQCAVPDHRSAARVPSGGWVGAHHRRPRRRPAAGGVRRRPGGRPPGSGVDLRGAVRRRSGRPAARAVLDLASVEVFVGTAAVSHLLPIRDARWSVTISAAPSSRGAALGPVAVHELDQGNWRHTT